LDFFYSFPFLGPKFYEMPQQFMQFMEETLLDCQKKIVEKATGEKYASKSVI
jgi:hypothetical protein